MACGLAGAEPRLPGPAVTDSLTTLFFLRYGASIRPRRALGPLTLLLAELALDRLDELVPGRGELGHALIFQHGDHVVIGDAQVLQVRDDLTGRVVRAVARVAVDHAVVGHRVQGRLRHGVH